jgi:hypothetical protein
MPACVEFSQRPSNTVDFGCAIHIELPDSPLYLVDMQVERDAKNLEFDRFGFEGGFLWGLIKCCTARKLLHCWQIGNFCA